MTNTPNGRQGEGEVAAWDRRRTHLLPCSHTSEAPRRHLNADPLSAGAVFSRARAHEERGARREEREGGDDRWVSGLTGSLNAPSPNSAHPTLHDSCTNFYRPTNTHTHTLTAIKSRPPPPSRLPTRHADGPGPLWRPGGLCHGGRYGRAVRRVAWHRDRGQLQQPAAHGA